jgi:hypothetical protein
LLFGQSHILIEYQLIIAVHSFFLAVAKILQNVGADIHIFSADSFISNHSTSARFIASISSIISSISGKFFLHIHEGLNDLHSRF